MNIINEDLIVSDRLLESVKKLEGFRERAYLDVLADPPIWTIGYGHTHKVSEGESISEMDATEILRNELEIIGRVVREYVTPRLTQGQFEALTDFAYNEGTYALKNSTLLHMVNASNWEGAALQFDRWIYAGTHKLEGLEERRKLETEWFTEHLPNPENQVA